MSARTSLFSFVGTLLFSASNPAFATSIATAAQNGVTWLVQQRNVTDGSWGATDDVKFVQTSEAVLALASMNQLTPTYYAGLAWLDNHTPANLDFAARRILTLGTAGGVVSFDVQTVQSAQNITGPGNSGWGLSAAYQGSPLDSGLSLQALNQQSVSTNVSQALTFLVGAQLTGSDPGWTLGQETASDPVTTAQVIQALIPLKTSSTSVPTAITNGLSALNAKVTTSSPVAQIALAALANLRNSTASTQAVTYLNALVSQQSSDGSWGEDPYATALVLRAFAADLSLDSASLRQIVNMPDNNLRAAVNKTLGHGALDAINVGELQLLTTLYASNMNITDLTGLQYATNLTYLDVSSNQITSFTPIAGLPASSVNENYNPGAPAEIVLPAILQLLLFN